MNIQGSWRLMLLNQKYGKRSVLLACVAGLLTSCGNDNGAAEPEIGAALATPHVAVRVEAENYSEKDERWTLIGNDQPVDAGIDPDPPHSSGAGGNLYLELLPDTRVTHQDELIGLVNFWGDTIGGPSITYRVVVPEAGRYLVYTRAYSTGTEDNGVHVGLNKTKPESGKRIQLCSGKNKWTWTSAQRTNENHCGVAKTIFLDIEEAGVNEIEFYAREDGFEIDQFILLKEPEDQNLTCAPNRSGDIIQCRNVMTGTVFGNYDLPITPTLDGNTTAPPVVPESVIDTDLDINITVDNNTVQTGEEVNYLVEIENKDNTNAATSVKATLTIPDSLSFISSPFCMLNGQRLECNFNEIEASGTVSTTFTAAATIEGIHRVDAQVTADQNDTAMDNNIASVEIQASPVIPAFAASITITQGTNTMGLNAASDHLLHIRNTGLEPISNAELLFNSESLEVLSGSGQCIANSCILDVIQPGETHDVPLAVSGAEPGHHNLSITLTVSGDDDTSDNELTIPLRISNQQTNTGNSGDIAIEVEEFNSQSNLNAISENTVNSAWFVYTAELQPTVTPDFDTTSPQSASGSAYVELLPDTRTGQNDPSVSGVSNFVSGDQSPTLNYNLFVNEPGEYFVHARIRSNNDQDASIHVGLNDQWLTASQTISVCNPDGNWAWTHQRSVDGLCTNNNGATLNIAEPGFHRISVAAATDGVELDKLVLRKDNAQSPQGTGPAPVLYAPVAIDLLISSTVNADTYQIEVVNPSLTSAAVDIRVSIEGASTLSASEFKGFDRCTEAGNGTFNCEFDFVAPDSSRIATLSIESEFESLTATLFQADDPAEDNNVAKIDSTVAENLVNNNSGTGSSGTGSTDKVTLLLLLLVTIPAAITRRRVNLQAQK